MKISESSVSKMTITEVDALDPVTVFFEQLGPKQGQITITCYGQAWTAYFGGCGGLIEDFIASTDVQYLTGKLTDIDSMIVDVAAVRRDAEAKGVECFRDDPWNDYDLMSALYGPDMVDWHESLPTERNPKYTYIKRIVGAVLEAVKSLAVRGNGMTAHQCATLTTMKRQGFTIKSWEPENKGLLIAKVGRVYRITHMGFLEIQRREE